MPSSIGISPLSTSHPPTFQRGSVRPSIEFYLYFSLLMDRSPGFGSVACNYVVLFTLAFTSASLLNNLTSLHTTTRRTILQKVPHRPAGLCVLVNTRFQVLFHSPPGVLFTFPSQYFYAIGHQVVFRLGGWSPRLLIGFHVSGDTLVLSGSLHFRLRDCHPLWSAFPYRSTLCKDPL